MMIVDMKIMIIIMFGCFLKNILCTNKLESISSFQRFKKIDKNIEKKRKKYLTSYLSHGLLASHVSEI